jgi:cytochrome c oxidase subunit IV
MTMEIQRQGNWELAIWAWLVVLLLLSILASLLLPKPAALAVISIATPAKAFLVAWNYMHLKRDRIFLYALLLPIALVICLALVLFPDVGPIGH